MADTPGQRVIRLMDILRAEETALPEIPLPMPIDLHDEPPERTKVSPIDLTGQHKLVLVFGPGRCGKKTLVRWLVERAFERGVTTELGIATVDPGRPALANYFPGVMAPGSTGLETFIELVMSGFLKRPCSGVVHFAADTTLVELVRQVPNLYAMLTDVGVTPVAFYMLSPRQLDLTILQSMEAMGFQPEATAAVLNLRTMKTRDVAAEFGPVRQHSVYRALMARGGMELLMPELFAAEAVENRSPLSFLEASQGAAGIGGWNGQKVKTWLSLMELAFAPVQLWLP
jgi:hypothetical protein